MAAPHAAPAYRPTCCTTAAASSVAPPHASPQARVAAPGRVSKHSAAGQSATPGMGGAPETKQGSAGIQHFSGGGTSGEA